jgi:NAD(P)-dependent dehydrogenase (short-subunit alcohol dehydrogenase family)
LDGKIAVITGGGGGIGGATSRRMAAEGATVVVNEIDEGLLDATVKDVEAAGGTIVPVLGDIREKATVAALTDAALAVDGERIDVLVNNVGDYRPAARFLKSDEEQWRGMYAINLEHVFRCTQAMLPAMVESGGGSIVNVSTVEAIRGYPGGPVYSAFNAGVIGFSRSLAVEVGRQNVRVNVIAPDLADTLQTPVEVMLRGRDPEMIQHWAPLAKWGEPSAYADVVVFLASDLSRYVTGHVVPVDGGTIAASGWYLRMDGKGWTNLPDAP